MMSEITPSERSEVKRIKTEITDVIEAAIGDYLRKRPATGLPEGKIRTTPTTVELGVARPDCGPAYMSTFEVVVRQKR